MTDSAWVSGTLKVAIDATTADVLDIIRDTAESRLDAQVAVTLASDTRANAFLAFIATLAVGAIGAYVATSQPSVKIFSVAVLLGLVPTTICTYLACAPREIFLKGRRPNDWLDESGEMPSLDRCLRDLIVEYQLHIASNRLMMERRQTHMNRAAVLVMATTILSAAATVFF